MTFEVWHVELDGQHYDIKASIDFAGAGGTSRDVVAYDSRARVVAHLTAVAIPSGCRRTVFATVRDRAISELTLRMTARGTAQA